MKLFLDSSVIVATGLGLQTRGFSRLGDFAERDDVELVTSVVVIEEVTEKLRQHLVEQITKSQGAIGKLRRMVRGPFELSVDDTAMTSWVDQYRRQIVSLFEESGGQIYPYPKVDHDELVARAINQMKPFGNNSDGYRDCLIWFSIIEALHTVREGEVEVLYFGTANTSDFASGKSQSLKLHDDLIRDLVSRDFLEDDVVLFGSLGEIISNHVKFLLAELSVLQRRILNRRWRRGEFESDIESAVSSFLWARPHIAVPSYDERVDLEIDETRVLEYQDAFIELLENGFLRVDAAVVTESVVIWEPLNEFSVSQDMSWERVETKWGLKFRSRVVMSSTVSFTFGEQREEVSSAVWQDDPLDIELLTIAS